MAFSGNFMCTSFKKEILEAVHNFKNSGGSTFKLRPILRVMKLAGQIILLAAALLRGLIQVVVAQQGLLISLILLLAHLLSRLAVL